MAQVLGVLKSPEDTVSAITSLKSAGCTEVRVVES